MPSTPTASSPRPRAATGPGGARARARVSTLALALALALATGLAAAPLQARTPEAPAAASHTASYTVPRIDDQAADSLRAFLITFGPGAAVWERFGHNALWIHDPVAGTDRAYHYGLFDMSEEGFLLNFLRGRMWYSMGESPALWMLQVYREAGRPATVQELRLSREQIRELQTFFQWNLRPENRVYRYDYFRDNCSTRIRDALDRVTDGTLHHHLADRPAGTTYRGQAVALTADDALLTTGMDLGLGPLADTRLSDWELAYIPMRLRDQLRGFRVPGDDGAARPIVLSEQDLPALGTPDPDLARPDDEVAPPRRAPGHLLVGLALAALLLGLGRLARDHRAGPRRAGRWGLALTGGAWGLLTGVLGLVLLGLWTLTDHEFAWRNENLLQANPLALGLAVLVPLSTLAGRATRWTRRLALALAALSILGLLIHPLPVTPQANLAIIALALPVHLALAWTLTRTSDGDEA